MKLTSNEKRFHDELVSAHLKYGGRIGYSDRTRLSKLRVDLGISGDRALVLEEIAKSDSQRSIDEHIRQDAQARDLAARKSVDAYEARIQREQLELEAEEKKKQNERERKRIQAEQEAQERAERKKKEEQERLERQKREESARRARKQVSSFLSFLVGASPIFPAGLWLLYDYETAPLRACVVGGCAVFALIMYVCRFRKYYWKYRCGYIVYAILMAMAVFVCPLVVGLIHLPASCAFLNSPQIPFVISIVSVALLSLKTERIGMIVVGEVVAFGVCVAKLVLSGHCGVGSVMGVVGLGIAGLIIADDGSIRDEAWRWFAMVVGMLISTEFGCGGHWVICSIAIMLSASFVVNKT